MVLAAGETSSSTLKIISRENTLIPSARPAQRNSIRSFSARSRQVSVFDTRKPMPGHKMCVCLRQRMLISSSLYKRPFFLLPANVLCSTSPWSPTGKARGTSMFFGGIRRSIPSDAQGFGGLSSSHSSTVSGRGLLRRRIKKANSPCEEIRTFVGWNKDVCRQRR